MGLASKPLPPHAPTASATDNPPHVTSKTQNTKTDIDVASARSRRDVTAEGSSSSKQLKPSSSWYGTWPKKSVASIQIARESILAGKPKNGDASADLSRFEQRNPPPPTTGKPPSLNLGKGKGTTDITMGNNLKDPKADKGTTPANRAAVPGEESNKALSIKESDESTPQIQIPLEPDKEPIRPTTAHGWLGWLGIQTEAPKDLEIPREPAPVIDNIEQPTPVIDNTEPPSSEQLESPPEPVAPVLSYQRSWFGLWRAANSVEEEVPKEEIPVKVAEDPEDHAPRESPTSKTGEQPPAGSSWAFWYNAPKKNTAEDSGQLAVAGEDSQNRPEPARVLSMDNVETKKTDTKKDTKIQDKKGKSNKRERPASTEVDEHSQQTPPSKKATLSPTSTPASTSPPNHLIPSVRNTYRLAEDPSIIQQLARLVLRNQQRSAKHVFLTKTPPKIKKAIAIGIHGLLPPQMLQAVIGKPSGTSMRFAKNAAAAIKKWAARNGSGDVEIQKVELNSEGKISKRVKDLWELLLNWVDQLRTADFIMVACHSQGVPVGLMLISRLIEFGIVPKAKIGVCAMAGVSLGPFVDYRNSWFSAALTEEMQELFELGDAESAVSKEYAKSLRIALKHGVRVTYCGSIDDQLVSMESSFFSPVNHPYIYRLVFIDGRIHAPDFIAHLVGFALKLRNLGVSDQGLIRELSKPVAGSLYRGEGHSRLYFDDRIYENAVEFSLATTSVGNVDVEIQERKPAETNEYILPWIMRGLLEENVVKTELNTETAELLKQFDEWKPVTKSLQSVKNRLEGLRSKL